MGRYGSPYTSPESRSVTGMSVQHARLRLTPLHGELIAANGQERDLEEPIAGDLA
jgi:hypothetical protein